MSQFDPPEDEEEQLRKRYQTEADDDTSVQDAASRANRGRGIASLLQGLSGILNKDKSAPNSVYAAMHDRANKQVDTAKADKKSRLLEIAEMQEQLKAKKLGAQRDADHDPTLQPSETMRLLFAKQNGLSPEDVKGMSYAQLRGLSKGSGAGGNGDTVKAYEDENGDIRYDYAKNLIGKRTGYKRTYDGTTGQTISGSNPNTNSRAVISESGAPLADVRTELEGQRAYVKGTAGQQVKDEQDVQVADANAAKIDDLDKSWLALYDQAATEGPVGNTGPVAGRVAGALSSAGIDMGPATNQANPQITREASNYIREQSGLQATDSEFKRLMSTIPTLGVDREVFQGRMKAWKEDVKRAAEKARKKAQPVGSRIESSATSEPPPPTAGELRRKTKDGRTAVFDANKQFLRYED